MELTTTDSVQGPCTVAQRKALDEFEKALLELDQVQIPIEHTLHGGMYARTAYVPAGIVGIGTTLAKDSILIVSGDVRLTSGGKVTEYKGYSVITGLAERKTVCLTLTDCAITTLIPTQAKTVEEAEEDYTKEFEKLQTRRDDYVRLHFSSSSGSGCGSRGGDDLLRGPKP